MLPADQAGERSEEPRQQHPPTMASSAATYSWPV